MNLWGWFCFRWRTHVWYVVDENLQAHAGICFVFPDEDLVLMRAAEGLSPGNRLAEGTPSRFIASSSCLDRLIFKQRPPFLPLPNFTPKTTMLRTVSIAPVA